MKKLIILLILTTLINVVTYAQTKNLGVNINSVYQEIRPVASADGTTLYFTVEGNPINKYKDGQDIWMSKRDENGEWTKAERLPDYINSQRYNGVYACSNDGTTLLVRGLYNSVNKATHRGFSIIRKVNNGWTMPSPVIVKDYNILSQGIYTGGTISSDEKILIMYFSTEKNSDINDLWISKYDSIKGEYSIPTKLNISEEDYDEISPYIGPDNKTLFYSSDRPGSIGDNDIWMTKRLDDTWMNWSEPINIGAPFNTRAWNAYFSIGENGLMGYVSTNNKYSFPSKLGGADIESDTLPKFLRPEVILPEITLPIASLVDTVTIHDTVVITKLIPCDPLDTMNSEQLTKELNKGKILFDFGSSVLRPDAYIKLDIIAKMMKVNPNMKIELGGHTDAIGIDKRNQTQSEERASSAKSYLIAKGIENSRIQTKGYSNTKSISNNKTDAGRQLNRRVDITVISE
jgi:outer membrane protein OmpA-like peptidoglycan-associated protein